MIGALPVEEIGINANAAPPQPIRRWRHCDGRDLLFRINDALSAANSNLLIAGEMDAYRTDGCEAFRASHTGDARLVGGRVQHKHAEADEGVAEEDCGTEDHHYEEDMDFLTEVRAREGDG